MRVWERFARGLLPALSYNLQVAEHLGDHARNAHYHQLQEHIHNFWAHTDYWTALARQYGYEENAIFDPDRRERSILAFVGAVSADLLLDLRQMAPPNERPQLLQQLATALRQGSDEVYSPTASPTCPCGVLHVFLNHGEMEQRTAKMRAENDANDAVLRNTEEELHEVHRRLAEQEKILADLDEQERIRVEEGKERKRKIAELERALAEEERSRAERERALAEKERSRAELERVIEERHAAWAARIKKLEARNAALAAQLREMNAKKAASAAAAADREVEAVRLKLERQQLDESA